MKAQEAYLILAEAAITNSNRDAARYYMKDAVGLAVSEAVARYVVFF